MTKVTSRKPSVNTLRASVIFVCLSIFSACGAGSLGPGISDSSQSLQSIQIAPSAPSISLGQNQQFTATGHYRNGSTKDISASVVWATSNSGVVTISGSGLATSRATGSATISATLSGVVGQGSITITSTTPPLQSIQVSPSAASVSVSQNQQFTATGHYSDGSTKDVTNSVVWASSNTTVATISSSGLATGRAAGSATISAALSGVVGSGSITVSKAILLSIAVTPADAVLLPGTLLQFAATGTFSDGSSQDITSSVTWASSNSTVASISGGGLATAQTPGSVTISATSGSVTGSTTLNVESAVLSFITIRPANKKIAQLTSQQFQAIGTYTDGSTHNVTGQVSWTSSNTTVAKIGIRGLAKALTPGVTTITATLGSISAHTTLTVTNATVVSISVTPSGRTIAQGTKLTFTATGLFSDKTTQIITRDSTWASDNPAVAAIKGVSTATAVSPGTANISATFETVSGSTPLHVSAATLSSISVTPASAVLAPTTSVNCVATGTYSDGSTQTITDIVTWTSSASAVASVNAGGKVTAQSGGSATITAQLGSISGDSAILVDSSPLTSIQVSPAAASIPQQTGVAFVAIGTFADGNTQDLTTSVLWTSSPASVATISDVAPTNGEATALQPGTATISALFDGQVGTATLTVTTASPTSLTVSPADANLEQGGFTQFTAVADFSDGTTKDVTRWVSWTSSSGSVAAITPTGITTTTGTGTTTVTATMNDVSGTAVLTVQ